MQCGVAGREEPDSPGRYQPGRTALCHVRNDSRFRRRAPGSGTRRRAGSRTRMRSHFIAVAEDAEPGLMSPDPLPTFELLEIDIGNLRSAMGYLRDQGEVEDALRIASALAWFWTEPRFLSEGQRWLGSLLGQPTSRESPDALLVRALIAAGRSGDLAGRARRGGRVAWRSARAVARAERRAPVGCGVAQSGERRLGAERVRSGRSVACPNRASWPAAPATIGKWRPRPICSG